MSAIVSLPAYAVGTQLLFCPTSHCRWEWAAWSSSEHCWHGIAAFWHGIVQHFVVEISPFVTAGHVGGESNAAFKAEESSSYVVGKFDIAAFSHVLWTSEAGCDSPPPRWSHLWIEYCFYYLHLMTRHGLLFFFFFLSSNSLLPSHSLTLQPAWK